MTHDLEPSTSNAATVTLQTRDGRDVFVRHIRPEDNTLLVEMFWQLSSETRWRRFFAPLDHVDPERVNQEARRLAAINPQREVALVALIAEAGREAVVAVARFVRMEPGGPSAEASIVVRDDFQGQGLGVQLFDLLVQVALAQGLEHMALLTHADNLGLITMVQRLGMPYDSHLGAGLCEIDLQLSDSDKPFFPFSASNGHDGAA